MNNLFSLSVLLSLAFSAVSQAGNFKGLPLLHCDPSVKMGKHVAYEVLASQYMVAKGSSTEVTLSSGKKQISARFTKGFIYQPSKCTILN